jgi:predicted DNA-binding transcriptional regulator YafY
MHRSSRPPLARIMAIDRAIRSGGWPNASRLANELEVTPRTVRRDITYLRDQLQAPVEFDPVRNGYRYSEPTFRLPFLQMTEGELVAVLLAERLLRQYRGTPFEGDLKRAFAKMTMLLPDAISVRLDAAADCLSVLPSVQTTYDPAIFEALARAAVGRLSVEMVYWTAGRNATTSRGFDPYTLMLRDEGWYAVGRCHHRNEVLVFALQRVRSLRETGERFDSPSEFRVEDYMGGSFRAVRGDGDHRVVLRFKADFAGRIAEKVWHASQTIEPMTDGGLILRFEVSDLREVKRWVMFWGAECTVLEPDDLRRAVGEELHLLMARYDRDSDPMPAMAEQSSVPIPISRDDVPL